MSKSNVVKMKKPPAKKKAAKKYAEYKACYHTHPAFEIAEGLFIYGGNCGNPIIDDADVYVALDGNQGAGFRKQLPWYKEEAFLFRITDMNPPSNIDEFQSLIKWLAERLKAGKKIHVGCIGGHGRTGLVFAALRKYLTDDVDATEFVRKNYCHKAVESESQIAWLSKHFGIKKVKAVKKSGGGSSFSSQKSMFGKEWDGYTKGAYSGGTSTGRVENESMEVKYVPTKGNIWGKNAPK